MDTATTGDGGRSLLDLGYFVASFDTVAGSCWIFGMQDWSDLLSCAFETGHEHRSPNLNDSDNNSKRCIVEMGGSSQAQNNKKTGK